MFDPFSNAFNGLQKFGDDLTKSIKEAQESANKEASNAQFASARNFMPQKRPLPARVDHRQISAHLDPVGESVLSPAPSVSQAPSVSSTSSERSVQSEGGDSARSNTSERSSQSSLIRVLSKLMGRDTDAPLNQAPSPFDSKNPEKNNNKESSKSFLAMFTLLSNSAIKFFSQMFEEEKTSEAEKRPPQESQQRVNKPVKAKEINNGNNYGGMVKFLRGLMPNGVFVQAEDRNTGQTVRRELPFAFPKTGINPSAISFNPPTVNEMQKSVLKVGASFKAKAGNAAVAFAGAYGVATEGLTAESIKSNIGGVASAVSFFARSSPSGSPSAFSAQNLRSGLSFGGSESMATTFGNFVRAVSSGSGSSASYGSGRYNSGVSFSAGLSR